MLSPTFPAKHRLQRHRLYLHGRQVTGAGVAKLGASAIPVRLTGACEACRRGRCFAGTVSVMGTVSVAETVFVVGIVSVA